VRRALAYAVALIAIAAPAAAASDPVTPLSDIHRGLTCTALTVVHGTDISSFDVEVLDVLGAGGSAWILVHVSGPAVDATGVASGFSGSPVYCPDAHGVIGNAGAISATIGQYGNDVALVTPIEQMLGIPIDPPSGMRRAAQLVRSARPLSPPLMVSGLSPAIAAPLQRAALRHGRAILATPAVGPLATFPPQTLVPGASVAVGLADGDLPISAIGTVTYRDGDTIYGFGHPFENVGRRALLLQDAYVFAVIGNPIDLGEDLSGSYKLALPGHTLGTLTSDYGSGVVGAVGAAPATVPVVVRVHDEDRDRSTRFETSIADEVDVGSPDGPGNVPWIASTALAEAIFEAFEGVPADQTGSMCARVRVREMRKPLRFCNRYVMRGFAGEPALALAMGDDLASALTPIDSARYDALHVTSISASARLQRGLRLATIRSVHGPHTARPGQEVRLTLRVRLIRGPLRTIHVTTRIPRDAPRGMRELRIEGTPLEGEGGGAGLELFFDELFGDGGDGTGGDPQTPRQVRTRFERTTRYDGVTARIGRTRWRLLRDDELRIDGGGSILLRVAPRKRAG
jgi:hypothetical protein